MKNLRDPNVRDEAMQIAKKHLFSPTMLDPGVSRAVGRRLVANHWRYIPVVNVIREAETDFTAHEALKEMAAGFLDRNEVMPEDLRDYILDYLKTGEEPKRYRHHMDLYTRNIHIALAVKALKDEGFWPVTRNDASDSISICDLVAEAAELSYDATRKIWNRLEPNIIDPDTG